ncbi:autophagy protein Apg6-domain-containing protein [Parasitella parasitica]|nr:autophagy protein Apg6-domain-containing protein [Parasitella parasitica]
MAFKCLRCKQPLRIDDSLANLDQASIDMLTAPLASEEHYEKNAHKRRLSKNIKSPPQPLHTRFIGIKPSPLSPSRSGHGPGKRDSYPAPSESFVVLTHSETNVNAPSTVSSTTSSPSVTNKNSRNTLNSAHVSALQSTHSNAISSNAISVETPPSGWSERLKVANKLFEVMSSKSSVDHPMCQECVDLFIEMLREQMNDVSTERDCYIEFLKRVKDSRISKEEEEELEKQLEDLKLAEKEASEELLKLQQEEEALDKELEELKNEMEDLDAQEEEFWEKSNEYQTSLQHFQNERDSINLKYDHDVKEYERLQKTAVYNDAFCIFHDGHFGTINGFRLGRLSSHPVEWSEINAAWGQTLLLLYTVASKLKFQFKTFRLVPMGSFSRIEKVDGDSVVSYELYGSGDFGINKMFFLNRRFDHAMVAVLNCLKQLTDYAEDRDKSLRLPYRIYKDKIGDLSIRIQFNQDESWTKALKYMLINMKWILVFASRANSSSDSAETSDSTLLA